MINLHLFSRYFLTARFLKHAIRGFTAASHWATVLSIIVSLSLVSPVTTAK
jgi:hypothetical protein